MTKWADYLIVLVHYEYTGKRKHIEKVFLYENFNGANDINDGEGKDVHRKFLIDNIPIKSFCTVISKNGKYEKGADVIKYKVNKKDYIKTEQNSTEEDNLENLLEY